jgi:hypothetical protein
MSRAAKARAKSDEKTEDHRTGKRPARTRTPFAKQPSASEQRPSGKGQDDAAKGPHKVEDDESQKEPKGK